MSQAAPGHKIKSPYVEEVNPKSASEPKKKKK